MLLWGMHMSIWEPKRWDIFRCVCDFLESIHWNNGLGQERNRPCRDGWKRERCWKREIEQNWSIERVVRRIPFVIFSFRRSDEKVQTLSSLSALQLSRPSWKNWKNQISFLLSVISPETLKAELWSTLQLQIQSVSRYIYLKRTLVSIWGHWLQCNSRKKRTLAQ